MNILVACEESQAVCKAFREKGHCAFSCDLLSCSGGHPEWHYQGDMFDIIVNRGGTLQNRKKYFLDGDWDIMIASSRRLRPLKKQSASATCST